MSNDFDDKIIDFSKKAKSGEDAKKRLFKGVQYVKILKDENGNLFNGEAIMEYAKKVFFIVTVVKNSSLGTAIYKYNVPYDSFLDFINEFRRNQEYGKIIDIERYVPEDLA